MVSLVGQRVAASVPQHVRMGLEAELGLGPRPLNHPGKPSGSERRGPLRGEDER
jgi:hypothetical protein